MKTQPTEEIKEDTEHQWHHCFRRGDSTSLCGEPKPEGWNPMARQCIPDNACPICLALYHDYMQSIFGL